MPTRERPADRGRRTVRAGLVRVLEDVHGARVAAGLSQRRVARAVGVSHSRIRRLEGGQLVDPPLDLLAATCAVVGLNLVIKAYPGGDPLRDTAHARLLARLQSAVHPALRFRTEQPFPVKGDLRAWDATIAGPYWICHVEAETAVTDGQAMTRRLFLKIRDGGSGRVLLLLSDTPRNRGALTVIRASLRDTLPLDGRSILHALRRGRDPGGNGILLI
jgi:transcriptional regulator with XRE-family HTH domain